MIEKFSAVLLRHYGVNSVKKYELTTSVFAALLLLNTSAFAEDKYPASDFQPKVVYQDDSVSKQSDSSASTSSKASSSSSDSQYPAANFEPKVLYNDENYKHTAAVPTSTHSSSATSTNVVGESASSSAPTAIAQKEESSMGYLLGLLVFGIAGFVLYKRGAGASSEPKSTASSVVRSAGGATGVGRYLMKISGTGVSRYLEKQAKTAPATKSAATGVAKYLANQPSTSKVSSTEAVTGVEKYMRKKG